MVEKISFGLEVEFGLRGFVESAGRELLVAEQLGEPTCRLYLCPKAIKEKGVPCCREEKCEAYRYK